MVVRSRTTWSSSVPAEAKYWGMKTSEIEAALRDDFDTDAKVLSIGPAGENAHPLGLPLAPTSTTRPGGAATAPSWAQEPQGHRRPRHRLGARWATPGRSSPTCAASTREYVLTEDNLWANEEGTPVLVDAHERRRRHAHPQLVGRARFDGAGRASTPRPSRRSRVKNRACYQCAIACRQFHEVGGVDGRGSGVRDHRPLRRQLRHRRHRAP